MTSSYAKYSEVIGWNLGPTCALDFSSTPPLIAYNNVFAKLVRAPKNCICLPIRIAETQQAIP